MKTLFVPLIVGVVVMAGCMGPEVTASKIQASYSDADQRYYDNVGGRADTSKSIHVPAGSAQLTVKAIYNCGGICEFTLRNPLGLEEKRDSVQGGKQVWDDQWFTASDPMSGSWRLTIEIQGGAQYAFGAYVEP